MNALAPIPTRRAEDWRYSDVDAIAALWPLPEAQHINVAAAQHAAQQLLQHETDDAVVVRDYVIDLDENAAFDFHLLDMGGKLGRITFDVRLRRGARFELNAALLGTGEQVLEVVTKVRHLEPDAISRQTVRAVLGGHATGSYLGKVCVDRGADGTDAQQSVKSMLLDRTATANARPELEIFADDVKCAHGATVGELDKMALFYCASRGLDPAAARALLLQAFIAGLFDGLADPAERERFEAAAIAKLEAMV